MKIICPACNREVSAQDIELTQRIAKCAGCNNIFSFSDKSFDRVPAVRERPQIELPSRFRIQNGPEGIMIVRRWLGPEAFFLLFFAVFWNGIVGVFVVSIMAAGSWLGLMPLSLHLLAGLAVGYAAMTMFLNSTVITIGYDAIRVEHGPLPVPGRRMVPRAEIRQLYSDERISHSKNGQTVRYGVKVLLKNEREIDLIDGLAHREEALFVEQQIERHLKLDDQEIPGELPR